jgi:mono/diheme cytochrome c family protein
MNEEYKKEVREKYERELQKGERFWPDSIFKDIIMALGIFVLLILLATFIGVPAEPKADPSDTTYVPRPEWYFLFLFKFLALYGQIPVLGKIEWIATVVVPGVGILALLLLPILDRNIYRHYSRRILALTVMSIVVVNMVILTLIADIPTTSPEGVTLATLLQPVAGLVIPGLALLILFGLSFLRKGDPSSVGQIQVGVTGVALLGMVALTGAVLLTAPPAAQQTTEVATTLVDQIVAGQDLYSVQCVECHGDDGKVSKIEGVKGLEGKEISPINGRDVLYTLNDAALAEVIAYGRPDSGMNPFGKLYGGELSPSEISYIVTFMRYSWDDRFTLPPEALKPLFPPLKEGEVPSYDVHIAPIVKRYCLSCHRQGKENDNYLMDSYDNILQTGDNAPNLEAGNPDSILLQVIQGHAIPDPKDQSKQLIRTMPPNYKLKQNIIDVFVRWAMAGMPKTAEDAAKLATTPAPSGTPAATPTP